MSQGMLGCPGAIQQIRVCGYGKRKDHTEERVQKGRVAEKTSFTSDISLLDMFGCKKSEQGVSILFSGRSRVLAVLPICWFC